MTPSLKISKTIIDRLLNIKVNCFGKLYGTFYNNTLLVIGFNIEHNKNVDISNCFPTEVDLCGIMSIGDGPYEESLIKKHTEEIDVTDTPVYVFCNISCPNTVAAYFVINEQVEKTQFEVASNQEIYAQFMHVRLKAELPLIYEPNLTSIKESMVNLRKLLSSGLMAFNIDKTKIFLLGNDNENGLTGISGDPELGALCEETGLSEGCIKKKKSTTFEINVLGMNAYKRITKDIGSSHVKPHAPIILVDKRSNKSEMTTVFVDALSLINKKTKLVNLYEILVESLVRNLKLIESCILKYIRIKSENVDDEEVFVFPEPKVYHFYPEACGHFVTWVYPNTLADNNLVAERKILHKEFSLPMREPIFRRANRHLFKEDGIDSGILINPHEGLNPSGNGGEVAFVKGKYSYYHYCQNNMDDVGWGCAYRSLQTLASWFLLQGYTERQVPTYQEIQKCLVDIGDKPPSFVGSKQWIGSTEVNFVLSSLLGVTSKILHVSSGEEMGSKGQELLNHFQTHGSPIMIGGGVLAHTILGVDYNKVTGNLKFLILDPHYTGTEDLHVIQTKGWCGWKGVNFWDKTAYYNMCLPQVPICI